MKKKTKGAVLQKWKECLLPGRAELPWLHSADAYSDISHGYSSCSWERVMLLRSWCKSHQIKPNCTGTNQPWPVFPRNLWSGLEEHHADNGILAWQSVCLAPWLWTHNLVGFATQGARRLNIQQHLSISLHCCQWDCVLKQNLIYPFILWCHVINKHTKNISSLWSSDYLKGDGYCQHRR